jgi:hypothetical protein
LGACRVDTSACPHFEVARLYWKKRGYPHIDDDLNDAFGDIQKEVMACRCRVVPRFSAVLGAYSLHKYRQKNKADREGARGGWRILAVFDNNRSVLYPILVWPKKQLADADDDDVISALQALMTHLAQQPF